MSDYINNTQDKRIENLEKCVKNLVSTRTAGIILTLLIVLMTWYMAYISSSIVETRTKVKETNMQYLRIEAQLSQIQTDLIWIKRELNNQ